MEVVEEAFALADCTRYYQRVLETLAKQGIDQPAEVFWAGIFVGICEQVMMKVKPAGMIGSEMPRCEEITKAVADIYGLHWVRLDLPGSERFEVWVCRKDDAETQKALSRLGEPGLSWGEYHRLRGELCGYSEDLIRAYTEGIWP